MVSCDGFDVFKFQNAATCAHPAGETHFLKKSAILLGKRGINTETEEGDESRPVDDHETEWMQEDMEVAKKERRKHHAETREDSVDEMTRTHFAASTGSRLNVFKMTPSATLPVSTESHLHVAAFVRPILRVQRSIAASTGSHIHVFKVVPSI